MLSCEEYKTLPLPEQASYLQHYGCYLHSRIQGWCQVKLYALGKFYVEEWFYYDLQSSGLIRVLNHPSHLEPYLRHIHLKLPNFPGA